MCMAYVYYVSCEGSRRDSKMHFIIVNTVCGVPRLLIEVSGVCTVRIRNACTQQHCL